MKPSPETYAPTNGCRCKYHCSPFPLRGFAKKKVQKSEITMEVGGWWVQVSLGIFLVENRPKIALNGY